jgi:twitching motility protein PilT
MEGISQLKSFFDILSDAINRRASDVHFSAGVPPCCRIDGSIVHMGTEILTPEIVAVVADSILDRNQSETFKNRGEVDLAYSVAGLGRFRVNVFRQRGSMAIAVRILNLTIPSPKDLGIPDCVVNLTEKKRGLVLVTGPTGSGKSTTLASLINVINQRYPYHVITLEDRWNTFTNTINPSSTSAKWARIPTTMPPLCGRPCVRIRT